MEHFRSLEPVHIQAAWLTIGAFDGIHLGHRAIIKPLVAGAHAKGLPAVVMTFHPHPLRVLRPELPLKFLTTPDEKANLFGELGVDVVITYPFDRETANLPGKNFLKMIYEHLAIDTLWVGYDFAFGKDRDTDVNTLQRYANEMGFRLQILDRVTVQGNTVSSSQIRVLLQAGDLETANRLLGRHYSLAGKVIPGDGRGKTIGIPTANLEIWQEQVIPANGVYACRAWVEGKMYAAATNIGVRPTFDGAGGYAHVETHLLDTSQDLYGKTIRLEFMERLRGEQKFSSVQALVNQIQKDISRTRRVFEL
jgi:riboflavin kinase/FMN adenylyltransferase